MSSFPKIVVYGSKTCEDTQATRQFLDAKSVPYDYIEIEGNPEAEEKVKAWNNGNRVTPTLLVGDKVIAEPKNEELAHLLGLS